MKYYNRNSNNFITDDFNDILEFESIKGYKLLERIQTSYNNVENYIIKKTVKNKLLSSSYFESPHKNQKLYSISIKDNTCYYSADNLDIFSYNRISSEHKKGYNYFNTYGATFTPESEFKNISTKGNYLFFHLPKDFILDNITRTLTDTDVQKFKKFSEELTQSKNVTLNHISKLIEKYDKKFTDIIDYKGGSSAKFPKLKKWRADFNIDFFMSLYHYGFFSPIVHDDDKRFLWGGTHRAVYGASLGYDVPNFVYYTDGERSEKKFFRISPPLFDNKCGIFKFDLEKKELSIKLIEIDKMNEYVSCIDDGCDIQGFSVKASARQIEDLFNQNESNKIEIDISDTSNKYKLNNTRYIDDSIKLELINFNIYNDFQLLNVFKNRNNNLHELKWLTKVDDFIGEFGEPVSLTYPIKNKRYHKGDYVYIEIPFGVYKDFIHGWTDDVCVKYFFCKENRNCNCYKCSPENQYHMTLKEVRDYIRKSKYWKNKKNTTSSSYKSFLSLKYLGVQRPIVNLSTFLQRGVHRSLFLSETNSDVPNLFKIDKSKDVNTFISAKPYYKLKEYLMLDVDIKNKELSIYSSIDTKTKKELLTKISYK